MRRLPDVVGAEWEAVALSLSELRGRLAEEVTQRRAVDNEQNTSARAAALKSRVNIALQSASRRPPENVERQDFGPRIVVPASTMTPALSTTSSFTPPVVKCDVTEEGASWKTHESGITSPRMASAMTPAAKLVTAVAPAAPKPHETGVDQCEVLGASAAVKGDVAHNVHENNFYNANVASLGQLQEFPSAALEVRVLHR